MLNTMNPMNSLDLQNHKPRTLAQAKADIEARKRVVTLQGRKLRELGEIGTVIADKASALNAKSDEPED